MATVNFLGQSINDDNQGNLSLPPLTIHPSVGQVPTQTPFPSALYTPPTTDLTGLDLLNYFYSIVTGAGNGGGLNKFFDYTNNDDIQNAPAWSGFGPNFPGGIRALDGSDNITGSADNDVINGNRGSDNLNGLAGYDYLRGGQENDNVFGSTGNDLLNGNLGNDNVDGQNGNDIVRGGKADDFVNGGADNDILIGDGGADTLFGSTGADGFVFRADTLFGETNLAQNEFAADRILDFNPLEDYILANGVSRSQIQLTNVNVGGNAAITDTAISISGGILGVVIDTSSVDVFNRFFAIAADAQLISTLG